MNDQQDDPNNILTRLDKTVSNADPAQVDKPFILILVAVCSGVVLLLKVIGVK